MAGRRTPALIVAMAMVAAGCSGDGAPPIGPGTTSSTTATTTTTITTTPAPPAPTEAPDPDEGSATTTSTTTTTRPPLDPLQGLALEAVAEGYANPVLVLAPPGDPRLFVVEKPGRIRVIGGESPDDLFLDLRSVTDEDNLEQGLLGMAFHPGYSSNGRFFVHYTDQQGRTTLAEYRASGDPDHADPESGRILLVEDQPAANHNGGMIQFGPDGYLYVGLGDGGGANDRFGNGQRPDTLLGTILRLDVDAAEPYAIPPDNPFVEGGGAMEVWSYGLRNPWRFWIDGGLIYIGDVGQAEIEEIDVAPIGEPGLNYGWPITEGDACFQASSCETGGTTLPLVVYSHAEGCSVSGGVVYRGAAIPELDGHYFYGDWCGGWIRSFRYSDGEAIDAADWTGDLGRLDQVVSFGIDFQGEVYVVVQGGTIYRIVPVR